MIDQVASRTALMVAAYRARATRRQPPVCTDPWAAALAGPEGEELARQMDARFPAMELWVAVRTAAIDAHVAFWATARRPIDQIVLLGAGFDARAARLAQAGRRFFEVDHPASQSEKRRRIARLTGYPVDAAKYVPCDFEKTDFLDELAMCGFDRSAPALVIWEGVVSYLSEPAIRATLRRIAAGCHPSTMLLFDHLLKPRAKDNFVDASERFFGSLGETVLFRTNDILPLLYEEGFRHVRATSFDEACLTLTGTYDRARQFRFQRLVLASRTPTEAP